MDHFSQLLVDIPEKKQSQLGKKLRITVAAGALIFAHNKILLDRSESSDMWNIPGGIVNFGTSVKDSVVTDLKKELNLDIEIINPKPYVFSFELQSEKYVDRIILIHFLVKLTSEAKVIIGDDIVDYKWESVASNFRDCYPNVKPAVDHFLGIN